MRDLLTTLLGADAPADGYAFAFGVPIPFAACIALIVLAAAVPGVYWYRKYTEIPGGRRTLLAALRAFAMALLVFLALDPTLIAREQKPSNAFVAVVVDDSRSMTIVGGDGLSRGDRVTNAQRETIEATLNELRESHRVVLMRAGSSVERITTLDDLAFSQRDSALTQSMREAQRELEGLDLAATVLISDGVENNPPSAASADGEWEAPVYTIGAGSEEAWRDLAIDDIGVRRTNFDKSPVELAVHTRAEGLEGERAIVEVLEGSRVIASKPITIGNASQKNQVAFDFIPETRDWVEFNARIRLAETGDATAAKAVEDIRVPGKDTVIENNDAPFLVDNREKRYRILYLSGRPNWENKFVARSLSEDDELQLSSLIRISGAERSFTYRGRRASSANPLFEGFDTDDTGAPRYDEAVFIRLGLEETELRDGYPTQRKDLFPYDLVIWGDIEHDFFSQGHFEATRDFVAKRGGAFLMLGGPRSFSQGGYAGSVIETMLPVVLDERSVPWDDVAEKPLYALPTVEGYLAGAWSLNADMDENTLRWKTLSPLFGPNEFSMVRTGATVWSTIQSSHESIDGAPMFVGQRYGEGYSAALATGETWPWQMDMPTDDDRHERFWRQLVRTLVRDVPEPVALLSDTPLYTEGSSATIDVMVRDSAFEPREGLRVDVEITPPEGAVQNALVDESLERRGVYSVNADDLRPGMLRFALSAQTSTGDMVAQKEWAILVEPDEREFATPKTEIEFLRSLAETTGGAYLPIAEFAKLPELLPPPEGAIFEEIRFHLWWLPPFYVILAMTLITEWYLRRRAGQP